MKTIVLANRVDGNGLTVLLNQLANFRDEQEVCLDFHKLCRVTPAGLVTMTAWVSDRNLRGLHTSLIRIQDCPIKEYLQRMNFATLCGINDMEERFQRHDSRKRFVPMIEIPRNTDELAIELADLIAPGGDDFDNPNMGLWDAAQYVATELTNNVRQHGRGKGFIAAQTTKADGMVRIAVCDHGIGIRKSLSDGRNDLPDGISHAESVVKALDARISSKGQPSNEGVGLTLTSHTVSSMNGQMLICSGNGVVITQQDAPPEIQDTLPRNGISGTLITVVFKKSQAEAFNDRLHEAKEIKGLLQNASNSVNFLS